MSSGYDTLGITPLELLYFIHEWDLDADGCRSSIDHYCHTPYNIHVQSCHNSLNYILSPIITSAMQCIAQLKFQPKVLDIILFILDRRSFLPPAIEGVQADRVTIFPSTHTDSLPASF